MNYSFNDYRIRDRFLLRLGLRRIVSVLNAIKTSHNLIKNEGNEYRQLEIGPGLNRLEGFETLNIIDGKIVDYIMDISKTLKFSDNSFDLIYASHVTEHVPWFIQEQLFSELYRVLKPSGILEIWVPDFGKIVDVINDYRKNGINNTMKDGWYRFNEEQNVYKWANGRIFTYGDGTPNPLSFNWHRCVYTKESLFELLEKSGFTNLQIMDNNEVRGFDHGWISLGVKATKL